MFNTEYIKGLVRVRVMNVYTGHREVWDTNITSQSGAVHVSLNAGYIVLSVDNNNHVYNKDRGLLYSVTHDQVSVWFVQTHVTETGVFWGTNSGYKPLIMNLSTSEAKLSNEGIVRGLGVSGTRKGYIYVTDTNHADVGVYGTYLHRLHIAPPEGGGVLWFSGSISLSDTQDLIAFSTYNYTTPIALYRTHP